LKKFGNYRILKNGVQFLFDIWLKFLLNFLKMLLKCWRWK